MSLSRLLLLLFSLHNLASSEVREEGEELSAVGAGNPNLFERGDNASIDKRKASTQRIISVADALLYLSRKFIENSDHEVEVNSLGNNESILLHIGTVKDYQSIKDLLLGNNTNENTIVMYNNAPIHDAIYNGNYSIAKELLESGAGINSRGNFGFTPLHIAAFKGYETIVNLLLKRNASVDINDMFNKTPLHNAVTNGSLNIVKTLLDHGANINVKGNLGYTPLHIAALKGYGQIVDLLLLRNASVEIIDIYNDAPIHFAVYHGKTPINLEVRINLNNLEEPGYLLDSRDNRHKFTNIGSNLAVENNIITVMNALIEHGAGVNSPNLFGQTVLHEAAEIGQATVVDFLLSQNASLAIEDYNCYTPLQRAADKLNTKAIKSMLDYGEDINRVGCHNITALYLAIERNNTKLTEYLLSNNADPNMMSEEGRTPLDVAFLKSSEEIIKLLLENKAKVEDNSFLGSKILFDVVSKKLLKMAELLLYRTDNFELYPTIILNYAIGMEYLDLIKLLIKYGANIEKKDVHGNIPLSSAVRSKNVEIVKLILLTSTSKAAIKNLTNFMDAESQVVFFTSENNVEIHRLTALHIACYYGLTEIVEQLISYRASLEVRDERGYTPLHYACDKDHANVVNLLLNAGANKDSTASNGTTPLHIACRVGSFPIVKLLLSHPSANLMMTNTDGYTALHFAALSGSQETVKLLLSFNANKEAKTNYLKTPLHIASIQGQKEAAEILIEAGANKEAVDIDGMTPLHLAARERQQDMVKLLLSYKTHFLHHRNKIGSTPAHLACQRHFSPRQNEKDILKMLLSSHTQLLLDSLDNNQMTPLHIASRDNSSGCVEVLLSFGSNLYYRDKLLNIPIHYAALNGNFDIIAMFLKKDITLTTQVNNNKETPLLLASREGHADVVKVLLRIGNEGLIPDANGQTALHRSAYRGHTETVKLLRKHLANKDKEDRWGFTALNYAASWKGRQEVIGYLSKSLLNITLSSYLEKSNPLQTGFDKPTRAMIEKINTLTEDKTGIGNRTRRNSSLLNSMIETENSKEFIESSEHGAGFNEKRNNGSSPLHVLSINGTTNETMVSSPLKNNTCKDIREYFNDTSLHEAVNDGNLTLVKKLLENGARINSREKFGSTPLHIAAKMGYEPIVNFLLGKNASMSFKDMFNNTPIHYAVSNGNLNVVKALLDHGDNINSKGNFSSTPLHLAIQKGYKMVKFLLERNARVDIKNVNNDTPIHLALLSGNLGISQTLLYYSAKIDDQGNFGFTPLHIAAMKGYIDIVDLLLTRNASVDIYDNSNMAPIHLAVRRGHLNIVKALLDHGADVNSKGKPGYTPLHIAAGKGYENIVELLLARNANVDASDIKNDAPIIFATYHNNLNIIKMLLDHGANINHQGNLGYTPLHIATSEGFGNIVDLLLMRNASVDIRDYNNAAPINVAVYHEDKSIIRALLAHGNVNSKGDGGRTPLHIAVWKSPELVDLLLEWNATVNVKNDNGDAPIHSAVLSKNLYAIRTLLDHGANINDKGVFESTPLSIAALHGYESIFNLLLERNASVDSKDILSNTPLHDAIRGRNLKIVKALLDHGANINDKGSFGYTPLHIAAMNGYASIVAFLLERKASMKIRDNFNDAAIHKAIVIGDLEVIIPFLNHGANVNVIGASGNTPFNLAILIKPKNLNKSIEYFFESRINFNYSRTIPPVENTIITVMKLLLEHGADVNSQNFYGQTVLHGAAVNGYSAVIGYLTTQNASLGIEDYICYTPFQWAARNLEIIAIKTLLDYGDNINRVGCNNITALYLAIEKKHTLLTEYLLAKNADPNVMSEEGRTPLDVAFLKSSEELIKLLLRYRAKVEDKSFLGSKILFDAVSKNMLEMVKRLLESTKHFDSYPTVILNYALRMKYIEVVQLLIEFGGNVEKMDIHGNLPLSSAVISKNVEMVKLILHASERKVAKENISNFMDADSKVMLFTTTNVKEFHQLTALHIASYYGLTEIVEQLISYRASLEVKDERGYTPLHYACEERYVNIVKMLIDSGANKDSTSSNGTTPLHIACKVGSFPIVKLLLSHPSATLMMTNIDGYTALHFAALSGSQEIVKLLLNLNANKEAKTNDFKTPLHLASLKGHKEIADILLIAGANKEAIDIYGMTPLHFAAKKRHSDVVKFILEFGPNNIIRDKNGSTCLHLACENHINFNQEEKDIVRMLLHYHYYVNSINYNHMTPLHIASRDNSSGCAEVLLSNGGSVFSRDKLLNLPIHYAALNGNLKILFMLLTKYQIVSTEVNSKKETPLFLASREGHTEIVEMLLQIGNKGLVPDINGRTALHRSACRGHLEIVKLLRQNRANKDKEDRWGFTALNYAASWKGYQDVIGYLSTTLQNITLSSYLDKSNPFPNQFKL